MKLLTTRSNNSRCSMTASLYLLFDSALSERRGKDVRGKSSSLNPQRRQEYDISNGVLQQRNRGQRSNLQPDHRQRFFTAERGEICSFTGGPSDLQSVMMQRRWIIDRSTSQVLTGRRRQITTYFFIPFWQCVQLHVPLIQMVAVIIGAPKHNAAHFCLLFPSRT